MTSRRRAHQRKLLRLIALLLVASGCTSTPKPSPPRLAPAPKLPGPPPTVEQTGHRAALLARSLLGTPYRYGGADRAGFDCSGFVTFVFERLSVELPRKAEDQASAGRWVAPDELGSGDLVFFGDDRKKPYHVGLVVSAAGRPLTMFHASTSEGVVETDVSQGGYWLGRFMFGRRILELD